MSPPSVRYGTRRLHRLAGLARRLGLVGGCVFWASIAAMPAALAQPGDAAGEEPTAAELETARQAFEEGIALEAKNRWKDARAKFEQVAQVKLTPQVRFHLALCDENLGDWMKALEGFALALDEAQQVGHAAQQVLDNAPPRIEALEAKIPQLTIVVRNDHADATVRLDGKEVPYGDDSPVRLDPGAHRVELFESGYPTDRRDIELGESERRELSFDARGAWKETPGKPPEKPPEETAQNSKLPAYVVGGAGFVSLAAAGVFFGLSQAKIASVREQCNDDDVCDPAVEGDASDGQTFHTVSAVLAIVGGVAVGAGTVLYFALDDDGDATAGIGPGSASFQLRF